jgi:carbon monoxide dehydrogenase subunit G
MAQVDINPSAPAVASASAFVDAPIATVWGVLVDFQRWPSWNKSVSSVELKGDATVGSTFVWVADGARIVSRLEDLEFPMRITWTGRTLGIRAIHVWEFGEKDGGTVVHTKESFEGFLARMFRGAMKRMLSKTLEQSVIALKSEAEARHGATRA